MSNAARNLNEREEFWRPPIEEGREPQEVPLARTAAACDYCGTEYVVGSRFCHVCGGERNPHIRRQKVDWARFLDWGKLRDRVGLTTGSLIAFIVGSACVLAAVFTGLVYTATTVLDWQAVQVWRIEWLLAAITAFLAGLLLKRSSA